MADQSHLDVLGQGVKAWNEWRERNPYITPDLTEAHLNEADLRYADLTWANLSATVLYRADLREANLSEANLSKANLSKADLSKANLLGTDLSFADLTDAALYGRTDLSGANLTKAGLIRAKLSEADLSGANLSRAHLSEANLSGADLREANLSEANLSEANLSETDLSRADLSGANLAGVDLSGADFSEANLSEANLARANLTEASFSGADLSGADLQYCILVRADFQGSTLTNCRIYGISAWDLMLSEQTQQANLIITPGGENTFATVDDLEVAQFIYLLIDNRKLRNVIQTMTSKAVLILGNFTHQRKEILEAIRERLRSRGYLPILFDFTGSQNQRFIDTVTTVARLSRFVIADITQPRSVTQELPAITDNLPLLPIKPLILETEAPPHAFIRDVVVSDSVLKLHRYTSSQDLLASFYEEIIAPADKKRDELEVKRLRAIEEKL